MTEEAMDYVKVKTAMLEEFSTRRSEAEVMRDPAILKYKGGDIRAFLVKEDRFYLQTKFNDSSKLSLFMESIKSDQIMVQFILYRGCKIYLEGEKVVLGYHEYEKLLEPTASEQPRKREGKKNNQGNQQLETICEQLKNLTLALSKQNTSSPRVGFVSQGIRFYKCGEMSRYADGSSNMSQKFHLQETRLH